MVAGLWQRGMKTKVVAGFWGAVLVWRGLMVMLMINIFGYEG